MTIARKNIVVPDETRTYHATSRCVRRAFLCGQDSYTGKDFEHRRVWVQDRLKFLSSIFIVDILAYAIQSNHLHVILRTRPDLIGSLLDIEVVRRWRMLYPPKYLRNQRNSVSLDPLKQLMLEDLKNIPIWRKRLADLSWFMARLDEFIARQANLEDRCKGRFWESRFKCKVLLDEPALLTGMTYVDLNAIRAGESQTPEESRFTSAHQRIQALQAEEQLNRSRLEAKTKSESLHSWNESPLEKQWAADWLCPISDTADRKGAFSSINLKEYLYVLDLVGRDVKAGKRGSIPMALSPILQRLSIDTDGWLNTLGGYDNLFRRILGRAEAVLTSARTAGLRWFQGIRACQDVFG